MDLAKFVSRKTLGASAAFSALLAAGHPWPAAVVACVGLAAIAVVDVAEIATRPASTSKRGK